MTTGIHHITAIASDAKNTYNFYANILGLRLVKRTVNQDDVSTYHLFFGDRLGHPGMDLTFFIFRPPFKGKTGYGLVSKISLAVPEESLSFWKERFKNNKVKQEEIVEILGKKRLEFYDDDGLHLELVGLSENELGGDSDVWETPEIEKRVAIRNFYSATLSISDLGFMDPILTYVYGYKQIHKDDLSYLYTVSESKRAGLIEVQAEHTKELGENGAGTVHHIAFRAKDEKEQHDFTEKVQELGLYPTQVIDRFYFKSVYFRTPAGILFEIATDGPGFTADEKEDELGKKLALPPFLEGERKMIEENLPPLSLDTIVLYA